MFYNQPGSPELYDVDIQQAIASGRQRRPVMLRKYIDPDKIWLKKKSRFANQVLLYQKIGKCYKLHPDKLSVYVNLFLKNGIDTKR